MPKKQANPTRKNKSCIAVYVTKEVHAGLRKLADQDGRTLSNYLNRLLSQVTNT